MKRLILLMMLLAAVSLAVADSKPQNMAVMTGPQDQAVQGEKTFDKLTVSGQLRLPGISGLLKAGEDGTVSRGEVSDGAQYAVFTIPITGAFTDFELKASDDNYETMVFFYHSPDPGKTFIPSQIWTNRPAVFFTDSQRADRRQWIRQSTSQSIAAMRVNSSSRIGGVVVVVRDIGGSIRSDNAALVWTYCLMTPTGTEDDPSGRSIWRPIVPVWMTQPFNPVP